MLWFGIFLVCALAAFAVGVMSARSDLKGMTIPNSYSLIIIAGFIPAYAAVYLSGADVFSSVLVHGLSVAVTFVLTFVMFSLGMIGGGDSKLISAYSFWFGGGPLAPFLFFMAVTGSLLAVAAVVIKKKQPFKTPEDGSWAARVQAGENVIPYAVAILVGIVGGFYGLGVLSPDVWRSFMN